MNKLMEKLKKNSTIKESDVLSQTKFLNKKEMIQTKVPVLNIALSGVLSGGLTPGGTVIAGASKTFKTSISLVLAASFQKKYPDGVVIFYDSEYGSPQSYFKSFDIDMDRVLHTPIMNIEELKFDLMKHLGEKTDDEHLMIIVDSTGNLASIKEVTDAVDQKGTQDMSRQKMMKQLYRLITPFLAKKNVPMISIAHVYETQEMWSRTVIAGGTGILYSCDTAWIITKSQEKDGTDFIGYNFNINVEKSRFVREKSKIPLTVTYEGGINAWSGLLDIALESGHVIKPSMGWYSRVNKETGETEDKKWRAKDTNTAEFWMPVLKDKTFSSWVEDRYKLASADMITETNLDQIIEDGYADAE